MARGISRLKSVFWIATGRAVLWRKTQSSPRLLLDVLDQKKPRACTTTLIGFGHGTPLMLVMINRYWAYNTSGLIRSHGLAWSVLPRPESVSATADNMRTATIITIAATEYNAIVTASVMHGLHVNGLTVP
jgi:hypothetical protein